MWVRALPPRMTSLAGGPWPLCVGTMRKSEGHEKTVELRMVFFFGAQENA
jgi:hypothetical protein